MNFKVSFTMINFISKITEKELLSKIGGKTLLEKLLEEDYDLTINKILFPSIKRKPAIALILMSKGYSLKEIDLSLLEDNFVKTYFDEKKNELGIGVLPYEGELLLNKLENLFKNDGKSDYSLINKLICGYRNALIENYSIFINELKLLIRLKEKNMDRIIYRKNHGKSYFDKITGNVSTDDTSIYTLFHETGHMFHMYLTDKEIPKEYYEFIKNIQRNPNILQKIENFIKICNDTKKKLLLIAKHKYKNFFKEYYTENQKLQIKKFLQKECVKKNL